MSKQVTGKKRKRRSKGRKSIYRVKNWAAYNSSLKQRGSLTIWISAIVAEQWYHQGPPQRGAQRYYADLAIETALTLRLVYHLALRQAEGFLESILTQMGFELEAPDYTTLSRRQQTLSIALPVRRKNVPVHLVIDSTGVKVYGEGEWKVRQHGVSKRRTWRKLHLSIDEDSKEIVSSELTLNDVDDAEIIPTLLNPIKASIDAVGADGAYDKTKVYDDLQTRAKAQGRPIKIIIPPRKDAKIWQHGNCRKEPHPRDQNLRAIRKYGRKKWKIDSKYHRRSIAEVTMLRYKIIIGAKLRARTFQNQSVETKLGCKILNRMTHLGMPKSVKAA